MAPILPILHKGRTLTLRRTVPDDAALLFPTMYQNSEFMRLFRLNDQVDSEQQLTERLAARLQVAPSQSGYLELLMLHEQHGPIGIVALADYSSLHRRGELLIGLFDPAHRKKSFGLEGCLLAGDLAFNQYNFHRLYAYSYAYNQDAQKALLAGGFILEGVMQGHVFDCTSQTFVDLQVYGMTVSQFRKNPRISKLSRRLVGRDITASPPALSPSSVVATPAPPLYIRSGTLRFKGND